ncbi:hypothetical protein FRC08_005086 [Ceratobasidium sp. 394]|nr:hypothetical protein FRC08_005086 [Ceratobasidium sp. 394]KAG9098664.1 hypothetical protein FS749_003288 [Ceratobasidium sp. UAMH 11750]
MAHLEFQHRLPSRTAIRRPGPTQAAVWNRILPRTLSRGDVQEPIVIRSSSDEEDEGGDERPSARMDLGPGRGAIAERRARPYNRRLIRPMIRAPAEDQHGPANGQNQNLGRNQEYDVRMTHARAKPRIGFSFDFTPDEDEEASDAAVTKPSPVRIRTTIIIPDSPPSRPVDRKGKKRAMDEVLDLELEERNQSVGSGPSASASVSSPPRKKRKPEAAVKEVIEILEPGAEADTTRENKVRTVLVCVSCRRPLRMDGVLWALRCGHMIDSRCYPKLAERPVPEGTPMLDAEPSAAEATIRRRRLPTAGGWGEKGKGKGKAAAPPVPHVAKTVEWACPVAMCGRTHWSELRVANDGTSVWEPMKETGAVRAFV